MRRKPPCGFCTNIVGKILPTVDPDQVPVQKEARAALALGVERARSRSQPAERGLEAIGVGWLCGNGKIVTRMQ